MGKGRLKTFSDGVIAVISVLIYLAAIPLAFFSVPLADAMFVLVALMWFIPDRRTEQALGI